MNGCDILLLTASFGGGHHAATHALVERIGERFPRARLVTLDIFEMTTPILKDPLSQTYNFLTRTRLPIYNQFYKLRNHKKHKIDDLVVKLYYKKFERQVEELAPRIIISVFPTCAQFVARYKGLHEMDQSVPQPNPTDNIPHTITVITDVVAAWEWIHEGTDLYCVPAKEVQRGLVEKGVAPESILITGVPVARDFDVGGLSGTEGHRAHVLLMGSAMGKLSFTQKTLSRLGALPYDFSIVAGRDLELLNDLKEMDVPDNLALYGYTDQVSGLMAKSDLLVTKPGGATIFEAIQCNLPMVIVPSRVGQEMYNVEFIESNGLGVSFTSQEDMVDMVEFFMKNDQARHKIIGRMLVLKESYSTEEFLRQVGRWLGEGQDDE